LQEKLLDEGIRAELDSRAEKMQAKLRDAQLQKIPYMFILGDREMEEGKVAVRKRSGENLPPQDFDSALETLKKEIESKAL